MSAHRTLKDLFKAFAPTIGPGLLRDPDSAGTITAGKDRQICLVVTAAAEARTLAQPDRAGIITTVALDTDGGDLTLTVTGGYNNAGNTTLVLDAAGDFLTFLSIKVGTSYVWRLLGSEGGAQGPSPSSSPSASASSSPSSSASAT